MIKIATEMDQGVCQLGGPQGVQTTWLFDRHWSRCSCEVAKGVEAVGERNCGWFVQEIETLSNSCACCDRVMYKP